MTLRLTICRTFVHAELVSEQPVRRPRSCSAPPSSSNEYDRGAQDAGAADTLKMRKIRSPSITSRTSTEPGSISLDSDGELSSDSQSPQASPIEPFACRSVEALSSVGSAGHWAGTCKPCAYFHTRGCTAGAACTFCHLCSSDERKKRRKQKSAMMRAERDAQKAGRCLIVSAGFPMCAVLCAVPGS